MLELIKVKYDQDIKNQLEKRFIAFDVETTGLNPKEERIIELGAVLFENGQAVQKFNTLVNAVPKPKTSSLNSLYVVILYGFL